MTSLLAVSVGTGRSYSIAKSKESPYRKHRPPYFLRKFSSFLTSAASGAFGARVKNFSR
jgi:hypothetical protein